MSEDQRARILREWHREESFLPRLWEALEAARERRQVTEAQQTP
jgi:hypothetical protein